MAAKKINSNKAHHTSKRRIGPKALQELNAFRLEQGLPQLVMKQRSCLRCGTVFYSLGERTCGCLARVETGGFDPTVILT